MTAPVITNRQKPLGKMIKDGHNSLITLSNIPNAPFWERSVKPFGYEGGDGIDITTMHSEVLRQTAPRSLITTSPISGTCGYDPARLDIIRGQINKEQTVTIAWKSGDAAAAYGFLKSFQPSDNKEGDLPQAQFEIVLTNTDPITGEEELPVFSRSSGTGSA